MPTAAPPDSRRASVTEAEVAALTALLHGSVPLRPHDVMALLDPRGHRFQRLEWLGDSVLDHVVAHHRLQVAWRGRACCAGRTHATLVSDADLAETVRASGLVELLDWTPSGHRQADLVEACVAAAWLAGSWRGAVAAAAVLVHPRLAEDADDLVAGSDPDAVQPPCDSDRFKQTATLGSYVLEAAASAHLVGTDPGDEGELSRRRRVLLSGRLLAGAVPADCGNRATEHLVDHVQSAVGMAQLRSGAAAALDVATTFLPLGREHRRR